MLLYIVEAHKNYCNTIVGEYYYNILPYMEILEAKFYYYFIIFSFK